MQIEGKCLKCDENIMLDFAKNIGKSIWGILDFWMLDFYGTPFTIFERKLISDKISKIAYVDSNVALNDLVILSYSNRSELRFGIEDDGRVCSQNGSRWLKYEPSMKSKNSIQRIIIM